MLDRLEGWLPTSGHAVQRGERLLYGDHGEPGCTPRARGLANLALCGRLFYAIVEMTKGLL